MAEHVHTDECWEPDSGCDMGRNEKYAVSSNQRPFSDPRMLIAELKKLSRAYVRLLEAGKDRIESYGGTCDSVEQMERGDPHLNAARIAIEAAEIELRNQKSANETDEPPMRMHLLPRPAP